MLPISLRLMETYGVFQVNEVQIAYKGVLTKALALCALNYIARSRELLYVTRFRAD